MARFPAARFFLSIRMTPAFALAIAWGTAAGITPVQAAKGPQASPDHSAPINTVDMLQRYLQVNTVNPPGNESRAVEFLGEILTREGIEFSTVESAPGRGNLWARLKGGDQPALILLHHSDVVTADASNWRVPPFSGEIVDDYIYGRGALDMKSHGVVHLAAFLALHRSGIPLNRDVIFMATADEEAGSAFGNDAIFVEKYIENFTTR